MGTPSFIVLDGAMGSQLTLRGVDTSSLIWSARALVDAPSLVSDIHREYAAAGATVHRTNTFRTKRRAMGSDWERYTSLAVRLAREAVPREHRVAGSIAPLEDCYRPDLTPSDAEAAVEHAEMAARFAADGVDLLVCEAFPTAREARVATAACVRAGIPTWTAFTAGPDGDLLTPDELADAAAACVAEGAEMVFVNCVATTLTTPYVEALAARSLPFGVYANAATNLGARISAEDYVQYARKWIEAGARVVGSCCGTGPEHIRLLATEAQR